MLRLCQQKSGQQICRSKFYSEAEVELYKCLKGSTSTKGVRLVAEMHRCQTDFREKNKSKTHGDENIFANLYLFL